MAGAESKNEIIREHYVIKGQVQGVGFRYRANYAANNLGVTGWVQNEWDGSVVMELQGTKEQINRTLVMINRSSYIYIDRMDCTRIPVEEDERSFHVCY